MKKLLLILLSVYALEATSQITVTRNHLVVPGQRIVQATDFNGRPLASAGANMTWDFTDLSPDFFDSVRFGVAGWYMGRENFPKANIAMVYYSNENSVTFLDITNDAITTYGTFSSTDSGDFVEVFESRLLSFPSTYMTSYSDVFNFEGVTIPLGFDPDSAGPLPFIDSVQITAQVQSKSSINGWGTMKTPMGNYSALMQTIQRTTTPSAKMFTAGIGINIPQSMLESVFGGQIPAMDTSFSVNFWTNDATVGFPLVSYEYRKNDDSAMTVDWLMVKPESSGIRPISMQQFDMYPNPAKDAVTIECAKGIATVIILDELGRVVQKNTIDGTGKIALHDLAAGIYSVRLEDASGTLTGMKKLLVAR